MLVFLDGKLKDHFNESEKHILENPKAHGSNLVLSKIQEFINKVISYVNEIYN